MTDQNNTNDNELRFYCDEHIWFDDGNIVLLAGPSAPVPGREPVEGGDIYGFRCHKSVLGKHSPVFKDMFATSSNKGDIMIEGVPAVALADDWEDIRDLLRTFYAAFDIPTQLRDPKNLVRVAGILRLSKKYMIDEFWDKAVKVVQRDYPSTAEEWLVAEAASREIEKRALQSFQLKGDMHQSFYVSEHWPDPVATIKLASELDILPILPAAFYDLNRIYFAQRGGELYDYGYQERHVNTHDLDIVDLRRLTEGREELRIYIRSSVLHAVKDDWITITPASRREMSRLCKCVVPAEERLHKKPRFVPDLRVNWPCLPHIRIWLREAHVSLSTDRPLDPVAIVVDPIKYLTDAQAALSLDATDTQYPAANEMCAVCRMWLKSQLREKIDKIWTALPLFFSLAAEVSSAGAS
ncbi:hypothetical protein PHLGIDRAFT_189973 [Phlebiopsis gigantea 11061_1 CR5-6]|uniref:BTB domain-containing protein n=1 Tax=Phlebiopsis gigantea (strain 11061_1 CR5-6) TaxID=745531 RepID=A0A0C3NI88_PHLG1|nr:hypothetical protein PHLGIDRAFT_189973 [Phlebiopsis gigantea 11061_1 CR5-6]